MTSPTTNVEKTATAEQETDGDGIFEFFGFSFFPERNDDFITTL